MPDSARFRPNSPSVLHETLDHEAILVNLEVGTYYSLNAVGTSIWGAVDRGASVGEIIESIAQQSGGEPRAVATDIREFIDQLVAEQLLVDRDGDAVAAAVGVDWPDGLRFEPPVLNVYTDMQELLLLDPVHDVGVAGWPEPR